MNSRAVDKATIIAALNDEMRRTLGGKCILVGALARMDDLTQSRAVAAVRAFADFNEDNDPYGEHNCAIINIPFVDLSVMFKIDYYAAGEEMEHLSEDPSDPMKTVRVMSILLEGDY